MDRLQQLEQALIKADAAGNADDARALAAEIQRLRAAAPAPTPAPAQQAAPAYSPSDPNADIRQRMDKMVAQQYPKQMGAGDRMAADMGLEGGGAAVGQVAGTAVAGPVGTVVGGGLGAGIGNTAAQVRRMAMGEQGKFSFGDLGGAVVSGFVPGANLAGAPAKAVVREGLKQAGGNMIAKATQTGVDEQRLPTAKEMGLAAGGALVGTGIARGVDVPRIPTEAETIMAKRNAVLNKVRPYGVVVPPHEIDRGSDALSTLAGKAPLQQNAAKSNQIAWQKMTRQELGLGSGALPLTDANGSVDGFFKQVRKDSYEPYQTLQDMVKGAKEKVAAIEADNFRVSDPHQLAVAKNDPATKALLDPLVVQASADVDKLKVAREDVYKAYKAFKAGDSASYELWQAAKAKRDLLESNIEEAANLIGDKSLAKRLKESRTRIAKSYDIQDATNPGNGLVDVTKFGNQLLHEQPLTGKLRDMGEFALSFRREAVEAGHVPAPGVGNIGANFAGVALANGNPAGLAAGAGVPILRTPVRSLLLSQFMQDYFAKPNAMNNQSSIRANALRLGLQDISRQ